MPKRAPLTQEQIINWALAHHAAHGGWPISESRPIEGAPGEDWYAVNAALAHGYRGLPGGDSLARLLARCLGVNNRMNRPTLSEEMILAWADQHYASSNKWPQRLDGANGLPPGETWGAIDASLRRGQRGLPGGSSLAKLLRHRRPVRKPGNVPE